MDHGYMPIVVEVVEEEAFQAWLQQEKDGASKLASTR
jgi:heme/copper-type cytochrome/quinol oxidase subunit 2